MDLVTSLAQTLDLDPAQAQAVAGAVLGTVREQVGPEAASKLDGAVPELGGWQAQAKALLGAAAAPAAAPAPAAEAGLGGLLGGLMGAAGSDAGQQLLGALGGKDAQQTAALVSLLGKLGLEPSKAMLAAPIALDFLKTRLPPEWIDRALAAAPLLAGASGGGAPGALGSLGKLLG